MTKRMKCYGCGGTMNVKRETYLMDRETAGVKVTLAEVEVGTCPTCGERNAIIPRALDLNATVVNAITRKKGRLAGSEIRFLRSILGLSSRDLAAIVGARPETVSRWESETVAIGAQADKLLRLIATISQSDTTYCIDDVRGAASESGPAKPMRITLAFGRDGWRMVGEAPSPRARSARPTATVAA